MGRARDAVHDAISRWQDAGLIDDVVADSLRAEVMTHSAGAGRRWAQYIVATTAAVLTVLAAGMFLRWAWPAIGPAGRTAILAGAGVMLILLGMAMQARDRWTPVSYLLQTAGLGVLLVTFVYSEKAWPDASAGGIAIGILALATPLVTAAVSLRRNAVMPAINTALGYAFLFLFLDRATTLSTDTVIWIVDAVLVAACVVLVLRLARTPDAADVDALVSSFAASLYAGMVLIIATGAGPLDADARIAYGLDFWLIVTAGLTLWGIHRAPPGLYRWWYEWQLAICMGLAGCLAFLTTLAALDTSELTAALTVAAVGAGGLAYSLDRAARPVVVASCLVVLAAAWYFGATQGGALGAVFALAFSAALLFWVSARLGRREASEIA
jgi:hypothetical protein